LKATHRITQTESRKACKINYAIVEDGKHNVLRIPVRTAWPLTSTRRLLKENSYAAEEEIEPDSISRRIVRRAADNSSRLT
jgi:hypothetical protein